MTRWLGVALACGLILAAPGQTVAADAPYELPVRKGELVGGSTGVLVFGPEAIEYRTGDRGDARVWFYEDVQQLQVLSPTHLVIRTYEDQGWIKFGADRAFEFRALQGGASPELVAYVLARMAQPVVTSVMPVSRSTVGGDVRVKHQRRGRGSEGTLTLHDDALAYVSDEVGASRYWRFGDIASVLKLDPARLEIVAYEGGAGATRSFVFQVKAPLARQFYEALWTRVNPSPLPGVASR